MASVYSADGGRFGTVNVKGDVEFGLVYNLHTGSLELAIKQCKDLAAVDTKRNRSDPWVFKWFHCKETKSNWISNFFFQVRQSLPFTRQKQEWQTKNQSQETYT